MALGIVTKTNGGGDDSWMGSRHGVAQAATGTLKASTFTDKLVKSGTAVRENAGLLEPFTDPATQTLYGFVIGDYDVTAGDEPVSVLWHGRIITANLPDADFVAPTGQTAFIFD